MGLDMYLEARFYLPPYDETLAPIRAAIGKAIGYVPPAEKPDNDPTLLEVTGVSVRVGYWRKFDPLHQWFVNNVQGGHDDCRPSFVSSEVLTELEDQLDQIDDDPQSASEHFIIEDDSTLDETDVDYTIKVLVHAKHLQERGWDIYYRASS
ncbi:hypothetical protein ACFFJT_13070 [Dyella flava]|uniref:Uncharacterized protein n=1 Tax=Dyella flava TaxID=1920170 RepID=A0ABS2JZI0_9GAMM|nr:hypothetical protein [Dyella flava]MBM7124406.1 hypothetical protein [Dyella flava]GLQ52494.1 hypothetical protein GCM10010872_39430 [Dyella flava]